MPDTTPTITAPRADAPSDAVAAIRFVMPVVRELPRPAPEPPAYAATW